MKRRILTALIALLLPVVAMAAPPDDWVECDGTYENSSPIQQHIVDDPNKQICFAFDDSWSTTASFKCRTSKCSCTLVQDSAASGGTALVDLWACPGAPSSYTTTTCTVSIKSFSDDDFVNITRGDYLIENTTTAGAGDVALFTCRGYE